MDSITIEIAFSMKWIKLGTKMDKNCPSEDAFERNIKAKRRNCFL